MAQFIHVGALAPYALTVTIESSDEDEPYWALDDGVTEGAFEVVDGSSAEPRVWSAALSGAAVTDGGSEITLTHPFAAGDLPSLDVLYVRAVLTHETLGTLYSEPFKVMVVGGFT